MAWASRVSLMRIEPAVPVVLGAHGIASSLVVPVPVLVPVAFATIAALGLAGLAGWRSPRAAELRCGACLVLALVVEVAVPTMTGAMLQWYYCVVAVYGVLLRGRAAVVVGPAASACYLLQVAVVGSSEPLAGVLLRAAVLVALGVAMSVAGHAYRYEQRTSETHRAATQAAVRDLDHAFTHDPLTGLQNRSSFLRQTARAIAEDGTAPCVVVIDIDRFSAVNEHLGHDVGDQLLVDLSRRLRGLEPNGWSVARVGGDEFAALAPAGDRADVHGTAAYVIGLVATPFTIGNRDHTVTLSAGAAVHDGGPDDAGGLLRAAKLAVNAAKSAGAAGFAIYEPRMAYGGARRMLLEQELRRAVRDRAITLAYQPITDLGTGRVHAVEALARWIPGDGIPVPPDEFIPLAEQLGLIGELGGHLVDTALRALARWQQAGLDVTSVAVNASPLQMHHPEFTDDVCRLLRQHRVAPSCLTLEITEGAVMQAPLVIVEALNGLRRVGVRISMDDFGTGHSSLSRLRALPIDELKIDRSFVSELPGDDTLARVALYLAQSFGLRTVAEGVESPDQLRALRGLGCDAAQGYLLSRPMVEADLLTHLAASSVPA